MARFAPNELVAYVDDVEASTVFYRRLLGEDPIETFPGFAVFALTGDFVLGLQDKHQIEPTPQPAFGGFEICLADTDRATVDALYRQWVNAGIPIAMEPSEVEFGYTFVAVDPDGHRLRVCATDTSGLE